MSFDQRSVADPASERLRAAILADFEALMHHVASQHADEFLEIDVTMSQAKVLYAVSVRPQTNMSSLAAQLGVGMSAVSGLVDRLVEHGYLIRHDDPSDRRQHLLTVSDRGAEVIDHVRDLNSRNLDRLLGGLTNEELHTLHQGISALERQARPDATADSMARTPGSETTTE